MKNIPTPPDIVYDFGVLDRRTPAQLDAAIKDKETLEGFLTWTYDYVMDLYSDVPSTREEALDDIAAMVLGIERSESTPNKKIEAEYIPDVTCMYGDDVCVFYRISFE